MKHWAHFWTAWWTPTVHYTPLDPEILENQMLINLAFIDQAAPDIKRKSFSCLIDLKVNNLSELEAIVTKVYNNKEAPKDRQA